MKAERASAVSAAERVPALFLDVHFSSLKEVEKLFVSTAESLTGATKRSLPAYPLNYL